MIVDDDNSLLTVKDLNVYYDAKRLDIKAVNNANFSIKKGEILGIVGESGAGKSTIGKAIMRLLDTHNKVTGDIMFNGKNLLTISKYSMDTKYKWKKISMIFQAAMNTLDPVRTIEIDFRSLIKDKLGINSKKEIDNMINIALSSVMLPESVKKSYPHELSGGMKQRIGIALALITSPELIIADEPTTALDTVTEYFILSMLKEKIKKLNSSMIYITHDLPSVIFIADRIMVMEKGRIVENGYVNDILKKPQNSYTQLLINSMNTGV